MAPSAGCWRRLLLVVDPRGARELLGEALRLLLTAPRCLYAAAWLPAGTFHMRFSTQGMRVWIPWPDETCYMADETK